MSEKKTNILITSAGIRGYIIKYFQEALKNKGKVFAADSSRYSPALYNADDYFIVPDVSDKDYITHLKKICDENNINGIISLNDLELPILSENKDRFTEKGIEVIVSNPKVTNLCYDKYETFSFLQENGFPAPKTFISLEEAIKEIKNGGMEFPVLIKPRRGSASMNIQEAGNPKELQRIFQDRKDAIIQEFIKGDEYGIDVFNNSEPAPVAIYAKKKIRMRAGETDKAISVYDKEMIEFIKTVAKKLGFYGPADIDLFKCGKKHVIMEINPRFGGGYPLSHALKANFPDKIISLINKEKIGPEFIKYPNDVVMMKQYEIIVKEL